MLILSPEQAAQLSALNGTGDPFRQIIPSALADGRLALNADLLADCGPGQTWEHYGEFLAALPLETIGL